MMGWEKEVENEPRDANRKSGAAVAWAVPEECTLLRIGSKRQWYTDLEYDQVGRMVR